MRVSLLRTSPDQLHCTVTSMVGLNELTKTDTTPSPDAKLRIFDCDVHPVPKEGLTILTPYLPTAWKERFDRKQAIHDGLNVPIRFRHPNGSVVRQDTRTPTADRRPRARSFSPATYWTHHMTAAAFQRVWCGGCSAPVFCWI